jgi:hypothetical protein
MRVVADEIGVQRRRVFPRPQKYFDFCVKTKSTETHDDIPEVYFTTSLNQFSTHTRSPSFRIFYALLNLYIRISASSIDTRGFQKLCIKFN